jgi:hypothetical protein
MIWAPASANIIAVNGDGPMPANSMILMPLSGPLLGICAIAGW